MNASLLGEGQIKALPEMLLPLRERLLANLVMISQIPAPTGAEAERAEVTSEIAAPAVEALRRVEIDPQEQEDAVLIHVFEKTQTLDEYRGGARDFDGSGLIVVGHADEHDAF